jgi:uncharacterized protein (TIGR01777 family)
MAARWRPRVAAIRIVVTGSHGLVGSALVPMLRRAGHHVLRLVRASTITGDDVAIWDPDRGTIDPTALDGADAVVHLAGQGIGGTRWTRAGKARIRDSRVRGTTLLVGKLATLVHPPQVLLSASATGIYGDRGDEILTESSPPGTGFRAEVCRAWESATTAAAGAGIRVVALRSGIVLSAKGGLLPFLVRPFQLGVGGPLGSGHQFVSWISLRDEVRAIVHLIDTVGVVGPVNLCAPNPVRNRDLAQAIGLVLHRPARLRAPATLLRMVAGSERADEVLLSSQRVIPERLMGSGFTFEDPDVEPALRRILRNGSARG